jgi:outer membrane protein OmpA-like peptidoglycan-associated protein
LTSAYAQKIDGRVEISNVDVERIGKEVRVKYTVTVPRGAVKRGYTMLFAPYISTTNFDPYGTDTTQHAQSLPAVAVRGRGTKITTERGAWAWLSDENERVAYTLTNDQSTTITATVPFQEWMYGSNLCFEAVEGGCCSFRGLEDMILPTGLYAQPKPEPVVVPQPQGWVPVTLADSLSTAFTFVLPDSEFDENEPFKIYDDERENALVVYFRVGKYDIVPEYLDNAYTLSNLVNVIKMIMSASDSRVERVVVAGFASPEGGFELNDRLAFDRAVSVKEYIMRQTGLSDGSIMLHNGSVDWRGLRVMVEKSNLPEKREILSIIDYTPVWDSRRQVGRLGELMRLNGGRTYRYLLNEYFPYLRSGAFIRVYYENE